MCFFTEIHGVSILRPWQQAFLKRQHHCFHSCEYEEKFGAYWNVQIYYCITGGKETISLLYHVGICQGVGRRKCHDDRRQHNSHFCLCHDGADGGTAETGGNFTAYQTEFMVKEAVNVPAGTRRFPRNHKQKSAEAALAQAGEQFMWFGRHDSQHLPETLQVLAATNCSAPSRP